MEKTYTTGELVAKLYENLRYLAPEGAESAYIAGYLYNAIQDIAQKGMGELVDHVDWTNQRVEAYAKAKADFQTELEAEMERHGI